MTARPASLHPASLHRPPAVPLVTIDPYTSIWSCADRLNDDWPRHWTGTKMALYAVVRVDGVAYRLMGGPEWLERAAEQTACTVEATCTRYAFRCGPAEVELAFVTPLLLDDLDLLSRPVTYVTFRARCPDGQARDVACYFDMTGAMAVNLPHERVFWSRHQADGVAAMAFRHERQPVLEKSGDHLRIDWGTAYLAGRDGVVTAVAGEINKCRDAFVAGESIEGRLPHLPPPRKVDYINEAVAALSFTLSLAAGQTAQETILIGYDDEYAIEFFGRKLRAWWRRDEGMDGPKILSRAMAERDQVLSRAAAFDAELRRRATDLAGPGYADLCALAWRHAIAAHKLCAGPDGSPLMFSKECFSNGCIATVDVTYPSAPMFLAFNPALLRAMIDPYFAYCRGPDWPFDFAAHDLGVYPKANGQAYRGFDQDRTLPVIDTQMPIEECGNMLILSAALLQADGDVAYVRRNWDMLTQWAGYLIQAGHDPGAQLCTDDFSGVLGCNVNLSCKAAMGLACAGLMAERLGEPAAAARYRAVAAEFMRHILAARDGGATRLAFDQPQTWSLKYNLVWDRVFGFGLLPAGEAARETAFYATQARPWGIPLDNRSPLTKPEWMLWAASLGTDRRLFADCVQGILHYANTTPNRVPLGDLYLATNGRHIGFQARSVVGGFFIAFVEGLAAQGTAGIAAAAG
jgi:hypothetical protein